MASSLILREEQTLIEKNFSGAVTYETIYLNEDFEVNDIFLNEVTINSINSREYCNMFIPLCFGPTMSDFNGLRLATHIRCTPGINQNKNIYLFSFVNFDVLLNHECFNILKTKGLKLIQYNFHIIQTFIENTEVELDLKDLHLEIKKLTLEIPANYEDNHSIANEWAIYRWSKALETKEDEEIDKITEIQNSNLYFKYLKTIHPISNIETLRLSQLKIKHKGNPKILYIDDEAEKGWKEIFYKIFLDVNDYDFIHLDNELNEKSKDEIIDIALQVIIDEHIDLVILDFRLHKEDFETRKIEEITGYRILKKIKEYNNGIQVIIFSATNKIWNLQALQAAGSDGFIIKESPELSLDKDFTKQSILNICKTVEECLEFSFLINFYPIYEELKTNLLPRTNYNTAKNPLDKNFVNEYLKWLKFGIDNIGKYKNKEGLVTSFLILFSVLENLANRIIDIDNPESVYINNEKKYQHKFRINNEYLKFFECNNDVYSSSNKNLYSLKSITWNQKILNALDFLSDFEMNFPSISNMIRKRNDIIHSNSTTGNNIEISIDEIKKLFFLITHNINNLK